MMRVWSGPSSSSLLGQDHSVGDGVTEGPLLDREALGHHRSRQRNRNGRTGGEVPRAADDLPRLVLADVDLAELEPVGVRMLARLEHLADDGSSRGCRSRRVRREG